MRHSYEYGLVKRQVREGVGIFLCDEHIVFSQDGPFSLGRLPGGQEVNATRFVKAPVGRSEDNTAANALLFMHVFEVLQKDGRWQRHDWTIKADPDAVVLPWRVRQHLGGATGQRNYLVNCNAFPDSPNFPTIYGAFEAYSRMSLQAYFAGVGRCTDSLPWQRFGEDKFMDRCLKMLGVSPFGDFSILGDNRCTGANCGDGTSAAYHDFKSQDAWFQCWAQATR